MNAPRICLSLFGTTEEICQYIRWHDADLYEIRLDLSSDPDGAMIRAATRKPLLFTAHGRPELLEKFWPFADYVDVEQREATGRNTIRSIHAADQDPIRLWDKLSGEHMTKIVLDTQQYDTIAKLIALNQQHKPLALCFAYGEVGAFSRVIATFQGSRWIYASIQDRATGAGQFTYQDLVETFRVRRLDVTARIAVFGIVGKSVSHSLSPAIHNRKFEEAALPWIYLPFPCTDLNDLLHNAPRWNSVGFSITHPYKKKVIPLLHSLTPEVERFQSCNTIALVDGKWTGTNTDLDGIRALLKDVTVRGSRVVIVGAGATARMFATMIRPEIADLVILNRTVENAKALAETLDAQFGSLEELKDRDYDLLIQTTPVGWKEDEMPVNPAHLRPGKTVIDSIYKDTPMLKHAVALGCVTKNGKVWFDVQADAQFRWWTQVFRKH